MGEEKRREEERTWKEVHSERKQERKRERAGVSRWMVIVIDSLVAQDEDGDTVEIRVWSGLV